MRFAIALFAVLAAVMMAVAGYCAYRTVIATTVFEACKWGFVFVVLMAGSNSRSSTSRA